MLLGAQLFTLRDYTRNLEDFAVTLSKVADIGYKAVQVSATCEFEPEWLKEQLKINDLVCCATHTNRDRLALEPDTVVAEHAVYGCRYIGIGMMARERKDEMENYIKFRDKYKPVAKRLKELGAKLMYHNHHYEFTRTGNGKEVILERMASEFAQDELSFILDTYWVQAAGGDPVQWVKNLSGRLECVHLKDMTFAQGGVRMAPVYEGNMNFDAVINACADAGTEYLIVEQDDCYGENPFDCLKLSYQNLNAKGLK